MLEFLTNHVAELANIMAILTPIVGFFIWVNRRLKIESGEIRKEMKEESRLAREEMKAVNVRIDHLYQVMLEMLKKS